MDIYFVQIATTALLCAEKVKRGKNQNGENRRMSFCDSMDRVNN